MAKLDWRSPEAYEPIRHVNSAGFAWEFLRRNPDYRRDARRSKKLTNTDPNSADDPVRHWGLSFRGRSRAHRSRDKGSLASDSHAVRRTDRARAA